MRRGLFVVAGIAAILLWWQPWRRWLQQDEAHGGASGWQPPTPASPTGGEYDASSTWQSPTSAYPSNSFRATGAASPSTAQPFDATAASTSEVATERYTVTDPQNADPIASDDEGDASTPGAMTEEALFAGDDATIEQGEAAMLASDAPPMLDSAALSENTSESAFSDQSRLTDMDANDANDQDAGNDAVSIPDNLILIEGIGPKISTILTAAGIISFAQLAETETERLNQIVRDAGITTANPTTWPDQARLAAEDKLEELKELQQKIKNGKLTD